MRFFYIIGVIFRSNRMIEQRWYRVIYALCSNERRCKGRFLMENFSECYKERILDHEQRIRKELQSFRN